MQCFAHGFDFLDRNRDADNWLLQIETFDPHEPFHAPARFKEPFDTGWNGPIRDWPRYGRVDELPEECEELRANYYADRLDVRLPARPAARLFRRSTTCGRTRRWSSPPTTASCSASTISGPRTG